MKDKMQGARIFYESLVREEVDVIFGLPGAAIMLLYDELSNFPQIRHILVRHEQGAVHAADGYARASGKPGVCLVTSGPGATNLITGLAAAHMDSIPIVAFTGQVATSQLGNDAFQEVDILGITRTCTKHNYLVRDTLDLASTLQEAFHIATTGRPGPVVVDLPKDVITGQARLSKSKKIKLRGYNPHLSGHPLQVKRAVAEILKAKRPVIYAGGGIIHAGAHQELLELAESMQIPAVVTLLGLGGFPSDHPLFLGMLGMHGTYPANMAITRSDLLIAVGCRFDDRATGPVEAFAPEAKIIHVDIDPASISKNVNVDIPIVGSAEIVLGQILDRLREAGPKRTDMNKAWIREIEGFRNKHPLSYENSSEVIKPQYVIEQIHDLTGGEAIITTEVGQNQMWTAHFYKFRQPRTLISSGGLGAMGYGLPAALGAQVAFPDRVVVDIAGDGSIQMNIQELSTAVQYSLPVKIAVLNNRSLGMVRQWQELFCEGRYNQTLFEVQPDFVRLAEAYGVIGLRATQPDDVAPCIKKALSLPRPVLMEFQVAPLEKVFPMVPPGEGIDQMLLESRKDKPKRKDLWTMPA